MTSPLPPLPPKKASRLSRFRHRRATSLSWRTRCLACDWSVEADNEANAAHYAAQHARDHQRRGVVAEMKMYPLPWWRRFWESWSKGE